jgi:hypothetical protein
VVFIDNGIYSAIKKNEILSFAGKWMELENIILSGDVHSRKSKAAFFLSYVEYRPNANTSSIMKNRSQTGRSVTGEER